MSEVYAIGADGTRATPINPGGWFGRTWLLSTECGPWLVHYVVEADSLTDAIDELIESHHGQCLILEEPDLSDYSEDEIYYGPSGQPCCLDSLHMLGDECKETPWPCRYYGGSLPPDGIEPEQYDDYINNAELEEIADETE